MIKVIVYDLDDTLYRERDFARSGFEAISSWVYKMLGVRDFEKKALEVYDEGVRGKIFDEVFKREGLMVSEEDIRNFVGAYRKHKPRICLYKDAWVVLNYYEGKLKQAIITDGNGEVQRNKVRALGVEAWVDFISYTDDLPQGNEKPSVRGYEKVMNYFKVNGEECIYIGDNPNKDFIGAKALNWNTIRIIRNEGTYMNLFLNEDYEAEQIISDMLDVKMFI